MNRETSSPSSPPPCNKPAQSSLVISLIFFIPSVVYLAFFAFFALSSWGIRLSENPNRPWEPLISFLGGILGVLAELDILWFPISFIAGLIAIFRGAQGRRAARGLPGNIGQTKSMIGIVLGLLVLLLPFVYFLCLARSGAFAG
jgi:hypothetical protein